MSTADPAPMAIAPRFITEPVAAHIEYADTILTQAELATLRSRFSLASDIDAAAAIAALALIDLVCDTPCVIDVNLGDSYQQIVVGHRSSRAVCEAVRDRRDAAGAPQISAHLGIRLRTFDGPPTGAIDVHLDARAHGEVLLRWWVSVPLCEAGLAARLAASAGRLSDTEPTQLSPRVVGEERRDGHRVARAVLQQALESVQGIRSATVDSFDEVRVSVTDVGLDERQLTEWVRTHLTPEHIPASWRIETHGGDTPTRIGAWLASTWRDELNVGSIRDGDTFFSLGGNSLTATRVLARMRDELGIDLTLSDAMDLFTRFEVTALPGELTLRSNVSAQPRPHALVHRPAERYAPFGLTDQQQAYLIGRGGEFSSGNIACHTYMEFEDAPQAGAVLDVERLQRAWTRVVRRHDALRLRFDVDAVLQRVDEDSTADVRVIDLREVDPSSATEQLAALRRDLSHRVADLSDDSLYDLYVVRRPDGGHTVLFGLDGLICDLAGTNVLLGELSRFYLDEDHHPAPLTLTFRDYVLAESEPDHTRYERGREYWWRRLDTLPAPPDLPLRVAPEDITEPRFVPHPRRIEADVWAKACELGAARGITSSGLVAAAYADTLAGWSRNRHFTINVPCFNRLPIHPEVPLTVGEFASLILVGIDATKDVSFAEFASSVQQQMWRDLSYPEVSGVSVLRELMRRHGGYGRAQMPYVFTSTTAIEGDPTCLLDGLLQRTYRVAQTPQVWMDLIVEENDGALVINWDSVDGLFDADLVDEMVSHFERQLRSLAGEEAWDIRRLDPVSAQQYERRGVLRGADRPVTDCGAHELFFSMAEHSGDRPAVIDSGRTVTYAELATQARAVASAVRRHTKGRPEVPVLIQANPSPSRIAAILGVLAAGGVHVPVDPHSPSARRERILLLSEASLVITDDASFTAPDGVDVLMLGDAVRDEDDGAPVWHSAGDQLAYLLFTSGSTGEPKGVAVEHRSVLNCIESTQDAMPIGPQDRYLAVSATHHDMSVYDLFGVLGSGAALVIPTTVDHRDADAWVEAVRTHGVTGWVSVPAMMEMALERAHTGDLDSLRTVILGGDWVSPALVSTLWREAPEAHIRSIGGPTETTVWNIWHPVTDEDLDGSSIPYGAPIPNTAYRVLDQRGYDRPAGVVGELYCSGVSLARGYWRDPARTATSFVHDAESGERMYRTGDLGYVRSDGLIEFVGRADHQLKVRGMRIEAGEIEAQLLQHERIGAAVVVGQPAASGRGFSGLIAYIVAVAGETTPESAEVQQHLAQALPAHMVPGTIVALDRLPLNANGKLDRAALPEPEAGATTSGLDPQGPLERALALIWSEQLHGAAVGRDDDFFALGGDSLVAARLVRTMSAELPGIELSLRDLFAHATVAGLAKAARDSSPQANLMDDIAALWLEVRELDVTEVAARIGQGAPDV
ncbi:MAG: amino acid adenylation domain-containing protein [Cumulibacter sp.]